MKVRVCVCVWKDCLISKAAVAAIGLGKYTHNQLISSAESLFFDSGCHCYRHLASV